MCSLAGTSLRHLIRNLAIVHFERSFPAVRGIEVTLEAVAWPPQNQSRASKPRSTCSSLVETLPFDCSTSVLCSRRDRLSSRLVHSTARLLAPSSMSPPRVRSFSSHRCTSTPAPPSVAAVSTPKRLLSMLLPCLCLGSRSSAASAPASQLLSMPPPRVQLFSSLHCSIDSGSGSSLRCHSGRSRSPADGSSWRSSCQG